MRCQPCERGRVKCSLTEGKAMTLRESMGKQRPAKKTATSMTWMYHPPHLVGGDDESEVEENNPPDDIEELSTPPKTVAAIRDQKSRQYRAGPSTRKQARRQPETESAEPTDERAFASHVELPPFLTPEQARAYHSPPAGFRSPDPHTPTPQPTSPYELRSPAYPPPQFTTPPLLPDNTPQPQ